MACHSRSKAPGQPQEWHVDSVTVFASKLEQRGREIAAVRPTAVNLAWAINELVAPARMAAYQGGSVDKITEDLEEQACQLMEDEIYSCKLIGENGAVIISTLAQRLGRPLRIETHCNAGALATAAWGTATSIIYHAFENGDIEKVWVDADASCRAGIAPYRVGARAGGRTLYAHLRQHGWIHHGPGARGRRHRRRRPRVR